MDYLEATSAAMELLDHAHAMLRFAELLAERNHETSAATDLAILAAAVDSENEVAFAIWERGLRRPG